MLQKTKQNGLYGKVVNLLKDSPKKLFTWEDIKEEFDINDVAAQNAVYNMHRAGKIERHTDKDENKFWRYAFKVSAGKSDPYVQGESRKPKMNAMKTVKGRRKGQLPSAKEMRTMFAQTQNQMAKMEDMMIAVVEEYEELEKMINKIKNITS